MKISVELNKAQHEMLVELIYYYTQTMPNKVVNASTIMAACLEKVWHDAKDKGWNERKV